MTSSACDDRVQQFLDRRGLRELPPVMKIILRKSGADAHRMLDLIDATDSSGQAQAHGQVGDSTNANGTGPARIAVRQLRDGILRLDCAEHPAFWMEVDVPARAAKGRHAYSSAPPHDGHFVVQRDGNTLEITCDSCPHFWIKIHV